MKDRIQEKALRRVLIFIRNDKAGALEFALTLLIALPLFIGFIEIGRVLHSRNALEYAADAAARSTLVEMRDPSLSLSEIENTFLDEVRNRNIGIDVNRIDISIEQESTRLKIGLSYSFYFLVPLTSLDEITLRAVRIVPMPTD